MSKNSSKESFSWTEEHESYCYQHHIPPAAKSLWQWLMRQGEIASEVEPDLSEFNAWVAKQRGKGYAHNYLKHIFQTLVDCRVIQVVKQYSWKIFRLLVRPMEWLKPPRKKREKNLQLNNSSFNLDTSNNSSSVASNIQQQQFQIQENMALLAGEGIHFDESETEVLDRPKNEIKLAIAMFKLRGGFERISENAEGWIRVCLRKRFWESPRNLDALLAIYGNLTIWDEFFPPDDLLST